MSWFYPTYWNDEKGFLQFLRRKLPIIPGGGSGFITSITTTGTTGPATVSSGVLNIPVYTGAGAFPGIDDVLSVGQALTTARGINFANNILTVTSAKINYTTPQQATHEVGNGGAGLTFLRIYTNAAVHVPWDLNVSNTAGDQVTVQGWNIDSSVIGAQPSWTTRMEYQYSGNLYEYHLQWSSDNVLTRLYRVMSFTFQNLGSTATDLSEMNCQLSDFYIRSPDNIIYYNMHYNRTSGAATQSISTASFSWQFIADFSQTGCVEYSPQAAFRQWTSFSYFNWQLSGAPGTNLFYDTFTSGLSGSPILEFRGPASGTTGIQINNNNLDVVQIRLLCWGSSSGAPNYIGMYGVTSAEVSHGNAGTGFTAFYANAAQRGKINTTGQWQFNNYGVGTFTGTSVAVAGFDSSGNIIEAPIKISGSTFSTFMGVNAGLVNTGTLNIALGTNSLNANVSGVRNVAIGGGMQGSTANSNNNIAIGTDTLDTDVSACGDFNIAIGNNTLDTGAAVGGANIFIATLTNNSNGGAIGDKNVIIGRINCSGSLNNSGAFMPGTGNGANNLTLSNVILMGDKTHNVILGTDFGSTITDIGSRLQINGNMYLSITTAPVSPVDGQIWREDNTNTGLKYRVNGVTKTITLS